MVALRGTKTKLAAGTVPVPPPMRPGLAWALQRARPEGPLFGAWGNVRRDLAVACAKVGIAPVTPNDLRRTFATWLRIAGVTPDLIGASLRHTTSRMAELVYGRIGPADLERLIAARYPDRHGLLMGGEGVKKGASEPISETRSEPETPCFPSAQGRNRTADTGIFNPTRVAENIDESANFERRCAANGRPAWVYEATAALFELLARRAA
jgi:hypothetical protein